MTELTSAEKAAKRKAQIEKLRADSKKAAEGKPVATNVYFDADSREVVVEFNNRAKFIFPAEKGQGLQNATDQQLANIKIFPSGMGLRWEDLDVDLSIPHLMEGIFGSKLWMKSMTAKGGRSTSEAKRSASRRNGKKGGRPRKNESTVS